jgi:hypothetical protein
MSGNVTKVAVSVVLGAAALVGSTGTAMAKGPAGSASTCPARYEAYTLTEFRALAEANDVPDENAVNTFAKVNKNGDSWICVAVVPQGSGFNFIDNQAVGLDR